jgi:hypothetical protein
MKLRTGVSVVALVAFLVSGCFTGDGFRSQLRRDPDQFNSLLDSMVNDKRTWVDPSGNL